ncbi:hypothetical protein JHK85_012957 [Glycine max]|nr:hypothetical protein JHK85_012957 [Glycine max]
MFIYENAKHKSIKGNWRRNARGEKYFSYLQIWWKVSLSKAALVRGHNGPVVFLSNKLLEEDNRAKHWQVEEKMVLFVVRLWSLSSSGRHDQRALKATLYGHENL